MSPRSLNLPALVALVAVVAGCPKPPPPPPPPAPTVEPVAKPPPPKCESFSEKCAATADTRAKITGSDLVFTPAAGWIYAQQSSSTIAQASETGAGIAFLGFDADPKDAKKELASRETSLSELFKQLGLSPLKKKVNWKKPDDTKSVGTLKISLWQLEEKGVRGTTKGPLVVVAGPTGEGKGIVGVGFFPDEDKSGADDAILKSIESLGKPK
jgi:hypothetical protein